MNWPISKPIGRICYRSQVAIFFEYLGSVFFEIMGRTLAEIWVDDWPTIGHTFRFVKLEMLRNPSGIGQGNPKDLPKMNWPISKPMGHIFCRRQADICFEDRRL